MIGLNPTTCIKQSSHAALAAGMAVLMALAACGGGGGSTATSTTTTTTTGSPSIAGSVVDGRVKNATLTLYSDQAMTQQVGSGTTDATGAFNITLSVKTAPDPIYIKSVGGIDLDTGMPAPTMCFVGNTGGANKLTRFHVTPLTNRVCKLARGKGMTLSAAQTRVRTDFGLSSNTGAGGLYEDPTATGQSALRAAIYRALGTGTMLSTIPAGSYKMYAIAVDDSNVGATVITGPADIKAKFLVSANVTVNASGNVTGTSGASVIRGRVQGDAMLFDILDNATTPTQITRVVGHVGLHGSVAGDFTAVSNLATTPVMHKGLFVGALIPTSGLNATGLATFVRNFYLSGTGANKGKMNFMARDIFVSGGALPRVRWGQVTMSAIDAAAGTVTMGNISATEDAGSVAGTPGAASLTFNSGEYVKSGTNPTDLLLSKYTSAVSTPAGTINFPIYSITAVGLRRGIYIVINPANANKVQSFGEMFLDLVDHPAVGGWTQGATHDVGVASIHLGMLNQTRSQALAQFNPQSVGPMAIPAALTSGTTSSGYLNGSAGQPLMVFAGGMFAMKQDANNDFANNTFGGGTTQDYLRVMEFFESGAFQGDEILGGTLTVGGMNYTLSNYPAVFVGFVRKQGDPTPSFTGTVNILARTMYATNYNAYKDAYVYGTMTISKAPTTAATGAATLTGQSAGSPSPQTLNLTIDKLTTGAPGMYHMHGPMGASQYLDITWPVGGSRALYMISNNASGTGNVTEIGEAYITQ